MQIAAWCIRSMSSHPKAEGEAARLPAGPEGADRGSQEADGAAGHGQGLKNLDFLVREANTFKLWAVAIQAMLKEHLNVDTNIRVVQISQWFEEAAAGNFDLAISAIVSSLMDPSDYFTAWYGKDGPQNYSRWTNEQFTPSPEHRAGGGPDTNKRKTMVRMRMDILENDRR